MAANELKETTMNEMEAEVDMNSDHSLAQEQASLEMADPNLDHDLDRSLDHNLDHGSLHHAERNSDQDSDHDLNLDQGLHVVEKAEPSQTDGHFSLRSLRAEAEIYALSKTLEYTGWNRRRAAQLLSISYRGILYKIRQHNLTPRGVQMQVQAVAQANQIAKAE